MSSGYHREGERILKERAAAFFIICVLMGSLLSILTTPASEVDQREQFESTAPARIFSDPNQNNTIIFHLHWDNPPSPMTYVDPDRVDWLNTSDPYLPSNPDYDGEGAWGITLEKTPASVSFFNFTISPITNAALRLRGNVTLDYWASSSTDNVTMGLTATLYDSTDLLPGGDHPIGSAYVSKQMPGQWTLHEMIVPLGSYDLPAGHSLILSLVRENAGPNAKLRIFYDQTLFDSTLRLQALSHFNISDSGLHGIDGFPRTEYGNQETIWAFANLSDALGIYDVENVTVVVKNISDNSTVFSSVMPINETDPNDPSSWGLFKDDFGPLPLGVYSVNFTARDHSNNTDWVQSTFNVISIDHFNVTSTKNEVTAGESFNVTIEVLDSLGNRMKNWSGTISIEAIDNATGLPIPGLSVMSVFVSSSDLGIVTVDENFTSAPEEIRIRATEGSASGQSLPISVFPGAIQSISVTPGSINTTAGATLTLTANATDRFGNQNNSWSPYWQMIPDNGTLTPIGFAAQFHVLKSGKAVVICQDNASGLNFTVAVNVAVSLLSRITVTPANVSIWEGRSTSITAVGYDALDNVVSIPSAVWSSDGFAMSFLTGSGQNGILSGGMVPESGIVRVTVGSIVGTAAISVIVPPFGPSLGLLGNQVLIEDQQKVITINWQDINGTVGLSWFVTGVNESLLIVSHNASSPNTVDIIPQPNANGINIVTFWVRDQTGYTNYRQITITVLPVNDPPAWINEPPTIIYVKFGLPYTFNYSYYVEDIDNNASQLILTPDPATYAVSSGLNLTYIFPDLYSGQAYYRIIKLVISDGLSSDEVTVTVWATSDTPPDLIQPLPPITLDEGQINYYAFDLDDYFSDVDGDILYYSQGFENVDIIINETTHKVYVSSPSEWSGQTTAVFIAKDPTGALRAETVLITVRPVNDRPQISTIGQVYVHYTVEYTLDLRLYVTDPDNGFEELTIITSDPVNVTYAIIPYPHLSILYPANLSGGAYTGPYTVSLLLQVTDKLGLSAQISFDITVSDNNPPVLVVDTPEFISFLEDTQLVKPYSLDLEAIFSDADSDELTFTFYGNENVSITLSPDGWVNFSAAQDWNGNEEIVFKATDTKGAWSSFKVNVVVIPVNDPPILDTIADIDHYGSRQWSLDIALYIHDVDDIDLSAIEVKIVSPSFVRVVGTVLYFEFPDGTDSTQVTIYVTDGNDNSNYVTFKVEIKKTIAEMIGYPWSLVIIMLLAGIVGYFVSFRLFPHKLEELFLIHNDGRLIYHEGKESDNGMDQDVVSAMFTAVQEFIRDSFKQEPGGGLKMMEFGDRKILIEKGNWVYAALIYSGLPPKSVFKNLTYFVRDIEGGYGSSIEHWDGTLKSLPGIQNISKQMILKKYHANPEQISSPERFEDLKKIEPTEDQKESP